MSKFDRFRELLNSLTPDQQEALFDALFPSALEGIEQAIDSTARGFGAFAMSEGRFSDWFELLHDGPRASEIAEKWLWARDAKGALVKMKCQQELIERADKAAE